MFCFHGLIAPKDQFLQSKPWLCTDGDAGCKDGKFREGSASQIVSTSRRGSYAKLQLLWVYIPSYMEGDDKNFVRKLK